MRRVLADAIEATAPVSVPVAGSIEVGFSPGGGAEALVLKVIDSAKVEIKVLAYSFSFTSSLVTAALLRAVKRGVAVSLVVDYGVNLGDGRSGSGRAALSALANAGCDVRTIDAFPAHHDKVLIVDPGSRLSRASPRPGGPGPGCRAAHRASLRESRP